MSSNGAIQRPQVVIIGAGFGGLSAAKSLAKAPFDVVMIDRYNYHMFQPLLYQVATAALSPGDIAFPIRTVFRRAPNVRVVLATVSAIDAEQNEVIAEANRIPFDYLIVATGARQAYFGHDDWAPHAHGLKTIGDAVYLRDRILLAFEKAETETDPDERRRLLNFVVVGGGATGVELTGAIAELAKRTLASDFRTINPGSARIVLVEAGPRLLRQFDESLSHSAQRALEKLGAEVRLGTAVTGCDEAGISMGPERIETRTIMWSAGVEASPAGRWLGAETDRAGRVKVEPDLSLPGRPHIFVLGDTALVTGVGGQPLPGVAPVAKQQGAYVAQVITARVAGQPVVDLVEREFGKQRNAIECPLAVHGDVVTESLERFAREGVVDALGFLQADDIRLPLGEPRHRRIEPLLDRVHVPGSDAHGRMPSSCLHSLRASTSDFKCTVTRKTWTAGQVR